MGNVLGGSNPFPVGAKLSNGKTVDEMGVGMTDAEKDERRKKAENCICPFLKTAYVQGKIDADEAGYVPLGDCYALMDWAGAGRAAFPTPGYFKKFGVTGIPLLHLAQIRPNDTGVLHAYIGEEEREKRFQEFVSFAKDGNLGVLEFNNVVNHFLEKNKASGAWLFAAEGELVTIVTAFGRKGGPLSEYMTVEDVRKLWVESEYPEGWIDERRTPETKNFTTIDMMMGVRLIKMQIANAIASISGNGPKPTEPMPIGFAPRPNPPYSDEPGKPPMTEEEIAKIPGNYERKICLWDSRSGAMQDLAEVNGGKEWDLNAEENKDWWQTTLEDYQEDMSKES